MTALTATRRCYVAPPTKPRAAVWGPFLSAHPATVLSRADLVTHVWPDGPDRRNVRRDTRTVDVHVSRLRRKLGPVHGRCLVTEHRAGYQFRPLATPAQPPCDAAHLPRP